jgi:hypothetical protein
MWRIEFGFIRTNPITGDLENGDRFYEFHAATEVEALVTAKEMLVDNEPTLKRINDVSVKEV